MKTIILYILGFLLLAAGVFFVAIDYVDGSWPRVEGAVVGSRSMNDVEYSVVQYTARDTTFQVISSDRPFLGSFESGKSVKVAYNPNSPGEAKILQAGILAILPWFLAATGALVLVGVTIVRKRNQEVEVDDDESPPSAESADPPSHQV